MDEIRLFLGGDVMTGRGIDQALPHPSDPKLHEESITSAADYVRLAERRNGPIPRPMPVADPWGDALAELARARPHARIVNLETAVTRSDRWADKGIHYRMHPANVGCLTAAGIDCCALANNHVLDWGAAGLVETLDTLERAGIRTAGAGRDLAAAQAPARIPAGPDAGVLVFSVAFESSGVPRTWAAGPDRPGVDLLGDSTEPTLAALGDRIRAARRPGDLVVLSVHWGPNWGYERSAAEVAFARAAIDRAGADVFHGHSSHHVRAIEVHAGKLILHGCGDLLDDYEGIGGWEEFRADLGLLYFPTLEAGTGRLLRLEMVPTHMRRFRLRRAGTDDAQVLCGVLDWEGQAFGTAARLRGDGRIELAWPGAPGC